MKVHLHFLKDIIRFRFRNYHSKNIYGNSLRELPKKSKLLFLNKINNIWGIK